MSSPSRDRHLRSERRRRVSTASSAPVAARRNGPQPVDPLEIFTGLAAAYVPVFCDGLRLELAAGGGGGDTGVHLSYPPEAESDDGVDGDRTAAVESDAAGAVDDPGVLDARGADGDARPEPASTVLAAQSVAPGRIVLTVRGELIEGEAPIAGTITCTWRDLARPSEVDAVVARMLAEQAVAKIRIEHLAAALHEQRTRTANLEEALATNREIGQAIGILMATDHLTAEQVFDLLRAASQRTHRKLRDIAADVVETGALAVAVATEPEAYAESGSVGR
jgi:hypothetical protein